MLRNKVILKFFMQLLLGKNDRIYKISYKTYLFENYLKFLIKKSFEFFFIELFFLSFICLKNILAFFRSTKNL